MHGHRRTTPASSDEEEASDEEEDASQESSEPDVDESDLERVEKILDVREDKGGKEKIFVKFKGAALNTLVDSVRFRSAWID